MFERKSRILIPDNTPLSVLSLLGEAALDWLFMPGAEVWITDMVKEEALRDPDPGSDPRHGQRQILRRWFEQNASRIHVQPSSEGDEYRKAMEAWRLTGNLPHLKPSWADRGEVSIFQALKAADAVLESGEAVLVIMDDRRARAALRTLGYDLDLMSSESFVSWMAEEYRLPGADTAWQTIKMVMSDAVPRLRPDDDEPISTFSM